MLKKGILLVALSLTFVACKETAKTDAKTGNKMNDLVAKSKASELGPAIGTYKNLLNVYVAETSRLGSWEDIGYEAPMKKIATGKSESDTFIYEDFSANGMVGVKASNKEQLSQCPQGSVWKISCKKLKDEANYMSIACQCDVDEKCAYLTPFFERLCP